MARRLLCGMGWDYLWMDPSDTMCAVGGREGESRGSETVTAQGT